MKYGLLASLTELNQQNKKLKIDAERYQHLRKLVDAQSIRGVWPWSSSTKMDAAIDTTIDATRK